MAASWDFPRNIASVCILTELGARYGVGVAECLANSGIRREMLEAPTAEIEAGQELRVARNLLEIVGYDMPLGLEAGERYHPTTWGIWGFAVLSSPTVRAAVEVGLRYLRLTSVFCAIDMEEADGEVSLVADDSQLPKDLRQFLLQRDAATLASLKRDMLPVPLRWSRLELQAPEPRYERRIREMFGVMPRYEQKRNSISADAAVLELSLPQGFLPTLKFCEAQCRSLLERRRQRHGVARQIRQRLQDNPREMPTMRRMATALDMPLRTLRRRLAVDGTDYESLVEEVRSTLAAELLTTTRLPVSAIADRLGYSEPSCFVRAFTRWKSMPPGRYREMMSEVPGG
jgi:AraC-like DNA-binding protein